MIRCFLKFSYIGTQFRGAQRLWGCKVFEDPQTIEGNLELAFARSPFKIESHIQLSSRTDSGVHALNNTAHVDISSKCKDSTIDCDHVLVSLNRYFFKKQLAICVKEAKRVKPDFHCRRNILSRTYLYRLAILRKEEDCFKRYLGCIEEWKRSWYYPHEEWDINKFREGAALLVGRHDFETFRRTNKTGIYQENIKTIYSIDIQKTSPLQIKHSEPVDGIDYYDITIKGQSFVHNQIRRIVGALNFVARDLLTLRDLKIMLQVPSKHSWPAQLPVAPPFGLYLCDIEYDPNCFIFNEEEPIKKDTQSEQILIKSAI